MRARAATDLERRPAPHRCNPPLPPFPAEMNATRMLARITAQNVAPARRHFSVLEKMAAPVVNMPNTIAEKRKIYTLTPELVGPSRPRPVPSSREGSSPSDASFLAQAPITRPGSRAPSPCRARGPPPPWAASGSSRSCAVSGTWPTAPASATSEFSCRRAPASAPVPRPPLPPPQQT